MFRNILVPVDFSSHSRRALDLAIALGGHYGAALHLLHCYPINPGAVSPYGIALSDAYCVNVREAARETLQEWAKRARDAGVEVKASLTSMAPSEVISKEAQEIGADLIVMGTRGLSGLKHVLLGSVAERTFRGAPCPVLTVRTGD